MNNREPDASKSNGGDGIDLALVDRLVERARAGEEEAFGELVRMFHARVYGVVFRMVPQADDAQDLAQLAWIKAWQRLGSYKQEARFFTWLYRIAVNTAMDFIRSRARKKEVELTEQTALQQDDLRPGPLRDPSRPDREMEQDEVRRAFHDALKKLSPEHKAALILREVEGLSYKEIARATKCRVGTVMSRIYYARRAIQESMKGLR